MKVRIITTLYITPETGESLESAKGRAEKLFLGILHRGVQVLSDDIQQQMVHIPISEVETLHGTD